MSRGPLTSSFAASALIQIANVATGILLARVLGPEARGELAAVILWPTVIAAAGSLGVTDAVAFLAARRRASPPVLAGTASVLSGVQGLALLIGGAGVVTLALSGYDADVREAGLLYLLNVPLALFALYLMFLFNGLERYDVFNALRLLVIAATALVLAGLALAGQLTVFTATLSYLAGTAFTALCAAIATSRLIGGYARFQRSVARSLLAFGTKSQLSTLSNMLNERLDQLVISIVLAPTELGLYVVAWTLSSAIGLLGATVALVTLPAVAAREGRAQRASAAARYVSFTFAASSALALPLIALTPLLIDLFFGGRFSGASDSARLLLLGAVPLATARVLESVLKAAERPLEAGIAEGVGLVLTAAGLAILLPTLGIVGAAMTSVLAYSAAMAFALWRAGRALETTPVVLLAPSRATLAAAAADLRSRLGRNRR